MFQVQDHHHKYTQCVPECRLDADTTTGNDPRVQRLHLQNITRRLCSVDLTLMMFTVNKLTQYRHKNVEQSLTMSFLCPNFTIFN